MISISCNNRNEVNITVPNDFIRDFHKTISSLLSENNDRNVAVHIDRKVFNKGECYIGNINLIVEDTECLTFENNEYILKLERNSFDLILYFLEEYNQKKMINPEITEINVMSKNNRRTLVIKIKEEIKLKK